MNRGLLLVLFAVACSKPRPPAAPAAPLAQPRPSALQPAADAQVALQRSEQVANNKPEPACQNCQKDVTEGSVYYGKPDMVLDERTLAEVADSIDATCGVLEAGLALLEKHQKTPDKAAAALQAWRTQHASDLKRTFDKALEIKARLKAAGYTQDIPAEVRPKFDDRMGKIHERLERMRDTYRQHRDVLEAFGAFFPPRGP
jgi:hypothetical protein